MNKKYCKICGAIMLGMVIGNFWLCRDCGYKECGHPDLPTDNIYANSSSGQISINLSANSTTTTPPSPQDISDIS